MSSITSGICASVWALTRRITFLLLATLGVLLFSAPLFAQGNFGRILGTVTDQSGGVISGATVTIIDKDRGVARTLTTDAAGEYNAPTLIPGTYTVRVEVKGFQTVDRQNVALEVGKEVRVDLTPRPGEQTQTVTVTEAIPLVETTNATLGGTINNAVINDMPLNGRNYQNLMALRPGVMIQPGGSPWTQSTNNVRPDENAWMMDGVLSVNFFDARTIANAGSAFTDAATIVPIDAIQEFNLQENPKAEYGWKPGAVVNVGIRSGTNTLHGTAYAFGRDQSLDARNTFNPSPDASGTCVNNPAVPAVCNKLPTELKQFGAVVGGPIKKDKLFFFAGYEGLRSFIGNVFPVTIPETAAQSTPDPKNSMVDAIAALQTAGVKRSIVSENLLGCTGDTPSVTGTRIPVTCTGGLYPAAANSTSYTSTFPNNNESNNGIAKIDYVINSKHRISGMLWTGYYNALGQDHPIPSALWETGIQIRTWSTVENWIWTPSSTVVNEARFGYSRNSNAFSVPGDSGIIPDGSGGLCTPAGCGGKTYPLNTGVKTGGLPQISMSDFGGSLGNPNDRPDANGPNPYFDFQDSVSYLRGRHALKFGGEFAHIEVDRHYTNFRGQINFQGGANFCPVGVLPGDPSCTSTSLEDFLAGTPLSGLVAVGNGARKVTWEKYAAFVQDDWRIMPKLMLNMGLRYEYTSPLKEVNGLFGNFDPNSPLGMVQQGSPSVGDTLYKPDYKNFSPRLGFAYDVTGKGTTVVRGGASIIYSSFFMQQFTDGPANSGNGGLNSVAQNPTAACRVAVSPCPQGQTFGGTIDFGQPNLDPTTLNWDPTVSANPGLNNGAVYPGGGLNCAGAESCSLRAVNPHLKTPYMVNYNFGVQHSITNNLSLEVGYVGNHGGNLLLIKDINQCLVPNDRTNCVRPYSGTFPYLKYINLSDNNARSNYNSLQTTLTQRVSHGLSFTAGYTYGHGLDNGSLNRFGANLQDSTRPDLEYANSDFDVRHRFTLTASYAIPGKKGFGQLLEGWKLNTILTLQSPQAWSISDGKNAFSMHKQDGELTDRWDFFGNPNDFQSTSASSFPYCSFPNAPATGVTFANIGAASCSSTSGISTLVTPLDPSLGAKCTAVAPDPTTLATAGCWVKGNSVMTPPLAGTFGTMGRNIFRDSGFKNVDFSVFKDFKFKERLGAQFRLEVFNLFNHPNLANPYGASTNGNSGDDPSKTSSFGCSCSTPDVSAGNPLIGSGSSRVMQLGLKLMF
jgi:carboxypeptidase family protein